jgi:glycerol kinase
MSIPRSRAIRRASGLENRRFAGTGAEAAKPDPVITGTVDAWTEAVSVGATGVGDLMLMYGRTMFLVVTTAERLLVPELWSTVGAFPGTRNLAGGMATSGAVTEWLRTLMGSPDHAVLLPEAEASGPGARGLLMLPYFAGERTPIADPDARGVIAGLTVEHTRGDLYRAALEATALGVRHNVETMRAAGAAVRRVVAVGGGTKSALWTRIVSDVTGLEQHIPTVTIGASYGAAHLAAAPWVRRTSLPGTPYARLWRPSPSRRPATTSSTAFTGSSTRPPATSPTRWRTSAGTEFGRSGRTGHRRGRVAFGAPVERGRSTEVPL